MALFLRRRIDDSARVGAPRIEWEPDVYLTDGVRLFRTLSPSMASAREGIVALEDCRTLEVVLCPFEDLAECRLNLVRR